MLVLRLPALGGDVAPVRQDEDLAEPCQRFLHWLYAPCALLFSARNPRLNRPDGVKSGGGVVTVWGAPPEASTLGGGVHRYDRTYTKRSPAIVSCSGCMCLASGF